MTTTDIPETLRALVVPIEKVRPYPRNPRNGDIDAIAESLQAHGQYRPIVVRAGTGEILAGNHTYAAACQLGWHEIAATYVDVDDEEAARIVLVDNRLNDVARYDDGLLAEMLQDLPTLEGTGYDQQALNDLVASIDAQQNSLLLGDQDPDVVPDVPEGEPTTKRGDLIHLGRHRLLCGDSTNVEDVTRLMDGQQADMVWTDPPYGIDIVQGGWVGGGAASAIPFGGVADETPAERQARLARVAQRRGTIGWDEKSKNDKRAHHGIYDAVIGDESTDTAVAAYRLCADLFPKARLIFWGGNHYASQLPDASCWIVWDKVNDGTKFADAELAWTNDAGAVRMFRHMWNGMLKASERGEKRVHPTQKPVALAEWCYETYGAEGDTVLDLFGGSGTALIAAEKTGRSAYLMELSEAYCDVIITRWETLTGQTAQRAERHERVSAGA